ncbi:ParA family protein [Roseospira marina]|uniref:ParA family protein n=1 Tax=Roseospira marina TaxID=140057 RepID=A0A5M6IGN4_9PROT|nr:ParA family protein [Roseospira marina]KAA5607322.1 ParA family protein [Roseospira marina]MBB4312518.1 chromosome partitioning protein [Roseospira marina]MBB5085466.1 chromosome partitioning protein [Roseospira marina]
MFIVAVANSKGGCGKTTVATHIAAQFAARGFRTGLADLDRQQSAAGWLDRRPADLATITGIDLDVEDGKLPKGLDRLVVDCPAAMTKATVKDVVQQADAIIVPVLPSAFDEDGTIRFLKLLLKLKPVRKNRRDVAFVANRTRARTRAADRLEQFLTELDFPVAACLRDTQQYANAAVDGQTVFETGGARAQSHRDDWMPLFNLLERWAQ